MLKGKWTLERLLGVGGMAAVYLGQHKIGRRDAIKILHPDIARHADLQKRFELEASATNRFHHAGAVEIRDFDTTEDGCPFLVMEMLDGESLGERARRLGEIKEPDVMRYADELLDVLVAAHKEGIVHRDIKLDNVFITAEDRVKVLDFGVARIRSGAVLTQVGTRLGTVAYMPPEQIKGLAVDGRADLFAVGATMFRLFAKRRIHEAASEAEMVVKMSRDPAPKLRDVAPHVSPNAGLVVDRALAFDAADRYPDAETMQADVRAVRAALPPSFAVARAVGPAPLGGTAFEPTGVAPAAAPPPDPSRPTPSSSSEPTRQERPMTPEQRAAATLAPLVAPDPTRRDLAAPTPQPTRHTERMAAPVQAVPAPPSPAPIHYAIASPRPVHGSSPGCGMGVAIAGVGLTLASASYFFISHANDMKKSADSAAASASAGSTSSVAAPVSAPTATLAPVPTPTPTLTATQAVVPLETGHRIIIPPQPIVRPQIAPAPPKGPPLAGHH